VAPGRLNLHVRRFAAALARIRAAPGRLPSDRPPTGRRVRVTLAALVLPMMVATGVALVVWWPPPATPDTSESPPQFAGTVIAVDERVCEPDEVVETPTGIIASRCGTVTVRVDDGPDRGRTVVSEIPAGPGAPTVAAGDGVVLLAVTDPEDPSVTGYTIADRQRGTPLLWLVALAAAVIVGFARWRGLAALVGLAVSFAVLFTFVLPAMVAGEPPLLVAVVGAAAIMFAVLYLTHGVTVRTSIAVLGTLTSLVLTGVLGQLAAAAAHLTGFGTEEAATLAIYFQNVDLYGLLLAGIIIGSLGVLDDVTVTQAATVAELAEADRAMPRRRLYRAASRVGRAHIASVVNTIVLAYAGTSLPVMLLVLGGGAATADTLTTEFVAQEIVRSAVATIGLVAAVPVTTALAVLVTPRSPGASRVGSDLERSPGTRPLPVPTRGGRDGNPWDAPATGWLDDP
jgi:uncharacterized membrane protein